MDAMRRKTVVGVVAVIALAGCGDAPTEASVPVQPVQDWPNAIASDLHNWGRLEVEMEFDSIKSLCHAHGYPIQLFDLDSGRMGQHGVWGQLDGDHTTFLLVPASVYRVTVSEDCDDRMTHFKEEIVVSARETTRLVVSPEFRR